jgi:hypothetical protein
MWGLLLMLDEARVSGKSGFGDSADTAYRDILDPVARERFRKIQAAGAAPAIRSSHCKQQSLYFLPLPHGQGSFRPTLGDARRCGSLRGGPTKRGSFRGSDKWSSAG